MCYEIDLQFDWTLFGLQNFKLPCGDEVAKPQCQTLCEYEVHEMEAELERQHTFNPLKNLCVNDAAVKYKMNSIPIMHNGAKLLECICLDNVKIPKVYEEWRGNTASRTSVAAKDPFPKDCGAEGFGKWLRLQILHNLPVPQDYQRQLHKFTKFKPNGPKICTQLKLISLPAPVDSDLVKKKKEKRKKLPKCAQRQTGLPKESSMTCSASVGPSSLPPALQNTSPVPLPHDTGDDEDCELADHVDWRTDKEDARIRTEELLFQIFGPDSEVLEKLSQDDSTHGHPASSGDGDPDDQPDAQQAS
jgi:hypothetical protein